MRWFSSRCPRKPGRQPRPSPYRQYTEVGLAKIIANYADDLLRSDVYGKEFTATVKSIGNSYGYSVQEIRAAQRMGRRLATRKAAAARRAQDQLVNQIAWFGDSEFNPQGLINYPGITEYTAPNPGPGTESVNKTADQILDDMNGIVNDVFELTKGVEIVNTLPLPNRQGDRVLSALSRFRRRYLKVIRRDQGGESMQVRYNKTNVRTIVTTKGKFRLMPGVNEVKDELFEEAAMTNPVVRHSIREGVIESLIPKSQSARSQSFADLEPRKQLRLVKECNNLETLKGWFPETEDPKIRETIKARIAGFTTSPVKSDAGKDNAATTPLTMSDDKKDKSGR